MAIDVAGDRAGKADARERDAILAAAHLLGLLARRGCGT